MADVCNSQTLLLEILIVQVNISVSRKVEETTVAVMTVSSSGGKLDTQPNSPIRPMLTFK